MEKAEINDGLLARISLVAKYKELTQRSFANYIGFSYTTLNKYFNKRSNTIDYELVYRILTACTEISADWLVTGNGSMMKEDENTASVEKMDMLVDTITTLQSTINSKDERIKELESKIK